MIGANERTLILTSPPGAAEHAVIRLHTPTQLSSASCSFPEQPGKECLNVNKPISQSINTASLEVPLSG